MKKIGIIGGLSIQSTIHYIEGLSRNIYDALGGLNSPRIAMSTLNFAEHEPMMKAGEWDRLAKVAAAEAKSVRAAGADFIILETNTWHKVAEDIEKAVDIPFLHIADATSAEIKKHGARKIGLLGTAYTMEQDFYKGRLLAAGLDVAIPNKDDRDIVNRIIFEELCVGKVTDSARAEYERIINQMADNGAEGVILGCTEIGMLVKSAAVPLYDTTAIHVKAAADYALGHL